MDDCVYACMSQAWVCVCACTNVCMYVHVYACMAHVCACTCVSIVHVLMVQVFC